MGGEYFNRLVGVLMSLKVFLCRKFSFCTQLHSKNLRAEDLARC